MAAITNDHVAMQLFLQRYHVGRRVSEGFFLFLANEDVRFS